MATALEEIPERGVAILVGIGATYRVLHDADVHRLQQGLNVVIRVAKFIANHPNREHMRLQMHSAALFTGSPVSPTWEGHGAFQLTSEEFQAQSNLSNLGSGRKDLRKNVPLGPMGDPDEIAKAASFLASDDATYLNGIEFFVDGGVAQT